MKRMKKLLISVLAGVTALSMLAGCGAASVSSGQTPSQAAEAASPAADTLSSSTAPSEPFEPSLSSKGEGVEENEELEGEGGSGSNILIAYFTAAENSGVDAVASASFTTMNGTAGTIKELEPGAAVIEDGFTVSERSVAEAQADVAQWVKGLGYAK